MDEKLTGWEELARLLKPPGVSEDPDPSSVVSMPTVHLRGFDVSVEMDACRSLLPT